MTNWSSPNQKVTRLVWTSSLTPPICPRRSHPSLIWWTLHRLLLTAGGLGSPAFNKLHTGSTLIYSSLVGWNKQAEQLHTLKHFCMQTQERFFHWKQSHFVFCWMFFLYSRTTFGQSASLAIHFIMILGFSSSGVKPLNRVCKCTYSDCTGMWFKAESHVDVSCLDSSNIFLQMWNHTLSRGLIRCAQGRSRWTSWWQQRRQRSVWFQLVRSWLQAEWMLQSSRRVRTAGQLQRGKSGCDTY